MAAADARPPRPAPLLRAALLGAALLGPLLPAPTASGASPAAAPDDLPRGTPIVSVRIERHDVFDLEDPSTSAWPYRWVNALHVLSREAFIRSLLLFKPGDSLDRRLLAESELILRGTGYLNPVSITARAVPGGAEVLVETRDQWTTALRTTFSISGDHRTVGVGLSEENFLGWGKGLLIDVTSDPERTSTNFSYRDITFLGTRAQLELEYQSASDGSADHLLFSYPFFSRATPRAGGIEWRQDGRNRSLWAEGEKQVEGGQSYRAWEAWGGLKLPGDGDHADRVIVGAFGEQAHFQDWRTVDGAPYPDPGNRDLVGPEVGFQHQAFRWATVRGFRAWLRQEDLLLGPDWAVTAGLSLPLFGGDRARMRYHAAYNAGQLSGRRYTWQAADLMGRVEGRGLANAITHLEIGAALTGSTGVRGRIAADLGHDLDGENQLTLGADTGLRGYDPNSFDGTSRIVANLEWRHRLTDEILHLAVLGVTAFADAGTTWGARVGPSTGGWRSDVGVGLLLELTRASVVRTLRLEVARPDRGGRTVFSITTSSLF